MKAKSIISESSITKSFASEIAQYIYDLYSDEPRYHIGNDLYLDYEGKELYIEFYYLADDEEGYGISIDPETIKIYSIEEDEDVDISENYDLYEVASMIETEMSKITEATISHAKKDKTVLKHMKSELN